MQFFPNQHVIMKKKKIITEQLKMYLQISVTKTSCCCDKSVMYDNILREC